MLRCPCASSGMVPRCEYEGDEVALTLRYPKDLFPKVVLLKSEIEKLREQVQNVE